MEQLHGWVGINSGPGTRGPTGIQLFGSLYTSQLLLSTSASSLATNHFLPITMVHMMFIN